MCWVENDAAWEGWAHVHHEAEDLDEDLQARIHLYRSLQKGAGDNLRHLLRRGGQPVATLSLFFGREAAGLYSVATAPSALRQGIGTFLVVTALEAARQRGYSVAVLGPTPESERMYVRIGFVRHDGLEAAYYLPLDDASDA